MDESKERQALGAHLARGQTLLMRAFADGIEDPRSPAASDLRCELVKVLRASSLRQRPGLTDGLELCIATLERSYSLKRDSVVSRRMELTMHEVLAQAQALASQLESIANLVTTPRQYAALRILRHVSDHFLQALACHNL